MSAESTASPSIQSASATMQLDFNLSSSSASSKYAGNGASSSTPTTSKKRKFSNDLDLVIMKSLKRFEERPMKEDQEDCFGKHVAAILKCLSNRDKALAKLNFHNLMLVLLWLLVYILIGASDMSILPAYFPCTTIKIVFEAVPYCRSILRIPKKILMVAVIFNLLK